MSPTHPTPNPAPAEAVPVAPPPSTPPSPTDSAPMGANPHVVPLNSVNSSPTGGTPTQPPAETPAPSADGPTITLEDGNQIPLSEYKVQLPSGQEMSYDQMINNQNTIDTQAQLLEQEQQRLAQWEQAIQESLRNSGTAEPTEAPTGPAQYEPMAPSAAPAPTSTHLDPITLGDMATDNEVMMVNHINQMNQYLAHNQEQLAELQQSLQTQQQITENQLLSSELGRVSDQYGVDQQDLLNAVQQTGVYNLDVLGQNLQLQKQMSDRLSGQAEQNARQASDSVGTGVSPSQPNQPAPNDIPGRGVTDYTNMEQVMSAYNII